MERVYPAMLNENHKDQLLGFAKEWIVALGVALVSKEVGRGEAFSKPLARQLQKSDLTLFGVFANLRQLMQIPYSQEYVQLPKIGKTIQKSSKLVLLQLSLPSLGSRAPFEYVDALDGVYVNSEWSISDAHVLSHPR